MVCSYSSALKSVHGFLLIPSDHKEKFGLSRVVTGIAGELIRRSLESPTRFGQFLVTSKVYDIKLLYP